MSLLARVSSMEALSPERGRSPTGRRASRDRKLSFSPVPGAWDPRTVEEEPEFMENIGAFEVPKPKRICEYNLYLLPFYDLVCSARITG